MSVTTVAGEARTLDRIPSRFHPRMLSFLVAPVVDGLRPRSYTWACTATLDQGREGACVGFGWTHEAAARPKVWRGLTETDAQAVYRWAQRNDYWPGEDYEGTSVDAGAEAARERGWILEWRWAAGVEEILLALGYHGPVVIGTDWWSGMFAPNEQGFLTVTGAVEGGHCTLLRAVRLLWLPRTTPEQKRGPDWFAYLDVDRSYVLVHNSWGPGWGDNGTAKISVRDLGRLFEDGLEACLPLRARVL